MGTQGGPAWWQDENTWGGLYVRCLGFRRHMHLFNPCVLGYPPHPATALPDVVPLPQLGSGIQWILESLTCMTLSSTGTVSVHTSPCMHLCSSLTCPSPPGKLDWVLLRGCHVVSKRMGNDDYSASDHKWLQVDVRLQQQ